MPWWSAEDWNLNEAAQEQIYWYDIRHLEHYAAV